MKNPFFFLFTLSFLYFHRKGSHPRAQVEISPITHSPTRGVDQHRFFSHKDTHNRQMTDKSPTQTSSLMNTIWIDLAAGYCSFAKVVTHDADVRDRWLLGSRPSRVFLLCLLFLVSCSRSSVLSSLFLSLSPSRYPLILYLTV